MLSGRSKWMLGGSLAIVLGLGTVTAMASNVVKGAPAKMVRELGQRIAAKAGLQGDKAVRFMKVWDNAADERKEKRQELVSSMKELAAEFKAGKKDRELTRALDRVQAAFLALVDGHGKTIDSLRATMSPQEQARVVLASKGHKILGLPGMKQAVPALIGHIRTEFLNSVPDLSPEARTKLEAIGENQGQQRAKLLEQRLETIKKLEAAGAESKEAAALVEQIAANGAALRETVAEQISEVRKSVSDGELARVLVTLGEKLKEMRGKARAWHEEAGQD
ncbi:MAG: hypothetical protein HY303_14640 [Candidatus Wallbacteria bacterium]|nr:hypothetical protein [Candidatus Wallbacteria bacterium]